MDSFLIANECLDSRLKQGDSGVICKLDVEKAYFHVKCGFLIYMLQRCGFSFFILISKDAVFLSSGEIGFGYVFPWPDSLFSLMGALVVFFYSSRGLRHDLLSPLLFVIVMEALRRLMDWVVRGGFLSGFIVGTAEGRPLEVSHMLFADDTKILCGADSSQLEYLRHVFTWFEVASGLKINLGKSEMVPVGEVPNLEELVLILGCQTTSLPM